MYYKNDHWTLFFFLDRLVEQREAYNAIKNQEDRNENKYLGLQAIKNNIALFVFMAAVAGLIIGAYAFFSASGVWQGILMIVAAIVLAPFMIIFFILALNCDIKQMALNNKPIGWISLLITMFILIAAVVAIVVSVVLI